MEAPTKRVAVLRTTIRSSYASFRMVIDGARRAPAARQEGSTEFDILEKKSCQHREIKARTGLSSFQTAERDAAEPRRGGGVEPLANN